MDDPDKTKTLDTRGYRCPMPVLKAEAALRRMEPGDILTVIADDPIAAIDIPHYCQNAGHAVEIVAGHEIKGETCFKITCGEVLPHSV